MNYVLPVIGTPESEIFDGTYSLIHKYILLPLEIRILPESGHVIRNLILEYLIWKYFS